MQTEPTQSIFVMSYITTVSGKHFDPIHPSASLIDLADIAHSLSLICRANGHVRTFYSVAQHSIACCKEAEARSFSPRVCLGCLLHDASEAYLSDVTRPVKSLLAEYLQVEEKLQNLIWNRYLVHPLTAGEKKSIFRIDDDMLAYEFEFLMPESLSAAYRDVLSRPSLRFVEPQEVEKDFLGIAARLQAAVGAGGGLVP